MREPRLQYLANTSKFIKGVHSRITLFISLLVFLRPAKIGRDPRAPVSSDDKRQCTKDTKGPQASALNPEMMLSTHKNGSPMVT